MSWITLIDNWEINLNEWNFTPIANDCRFFRISHNLTEYSENVVAQICQTEVQTGQEFFLFDQKRFLFYQRQQILQFDKPEFLEDRILAVQVLDLRENITDLDLSLKIEYYPHVEGTINNPQIDAIENKVNDLYNHLLWVPSAVDDNKYLINQCIYFNSLFLLLSPLKHSSTNEKRTMFNVLTKRTISNNQTLLFNIGNRQGFFVENPFENNISITIRLIVNEIHHTDFILNPGQIYIDELDYQGEVYILVDIENDQQIIIHAKELF